MDRWAEYDIGTLIPPAVVQHDMDGGIHQVWVYCTDQRIRGPWPRPSYNEAAILAYAEQQVVEDATRVPEVTADQMVQIIKPFVKDAIADTERLYADVEASNVGAAAKAHILDGLTHIRATLVTMRDTVKAEV